MQWGEQQDHLLEITAQQRAVRGGTSPRLAVPPLLPERALQPRRATVDLSEEEPVKWAAFRITATTPPPASPHTTMQRADEITTVQNMLNDGKTSSVVLIGNPGAGKSTLAALIYRRLQLAKEQGLSAPRHMVWLTLDSYTTIPDLIAAILNGIGAHEPGLSLLKPEQQISMLLRALRRPQENALIVLDQFESLLYPEIGQSVAGRGALPAFLTMLQTDLGLSRIVLTNYESLFADKDDDDEMHARSYLVSRISLPEGVSLLQLRGIQCGPQELSFIWQRCTGHVFSLVLFSALVHVSNLPIDTLLNDEDFKPMWSGDVVANLITAVYHYLNITQRILLSILSLFGDPTPLEGIIIAITSKNPADQSLLPMACERELDHFVQLGLVQKTFNTNGALCYAIHSLLRQYIPEHFTDDPQNQQYFPLEFAAKSAAPEDATPQQEILAAGHGQIAEYYRRMIPKQCPLVGQRQSPLDVEPIIKAIRHLCLGWQWQRACELLFAEGLHESMVQWGAWNALLGLYLAMLPPCGTLSPRDEALVNSHVAMLYGRLGEYQQSKTYFDQALAIQQRLNDLPGQAMTLANQGELLRMRGEYQQARQNFEHCLSLLERYPDNRLRCILLHNLALILQYGKNYERALYSYTEALHLATSIGNQHDMGLILTNLGMLLYENNEHREGLSLLLAALQMREMMHDPSVPMLGRFLVALEQKMGSEAYSTLHQEALEIQPQVLARFAPPSGL